MSCIKRYLKYITVLRTEQILDLNWFVSSLFSLAALQIVLDRKATSHTKNNDIYSSWVHAHFKMKLITDVWGAVHSLFYSFFLFIPSTSSLAASSKHWHTCQLEKCHPIPFLAGPMAEQMACGCQALPLQCIYCHAPPWRQKKAISEPIHSTGRGLEMCLEFVCLCMKRPPSCQIWGTTLSTPSDSLHHQWHHLLAWLMLNSTAEAHRRWGLCIAQPPCWLLIWVGQLSW